MLQDASGIDKRDARIGTTLATYVKSVERISAVGAVLQEVILRFCEFFAGFILSETETTALHSSRLNSED